MKIALRVARYRCLALARPDRVRRHAARPPECELVIARYDEELAWSDRFAAMRTIYDKGPLPDRRPGARLPNIGREAHAYLHHIIMHWDDLAEWTIFTQGDPLLHSPDFLELVENRHRFQPVQALSWRYLERGDIDWISGNEKRHQHALDGIPPLSQRNRHRQHWLEGLRVSVGYQDGDLSTVAPYMYVDKGLTWVLRRAASSASGSLQYLCDKYGLERPRDGRAPFCYAGMFAAHRDRIRARPRRFFTTAMSVLLNTCMKDGDKAAATELERLWLHIFHYT